VFGAPGAKLKTLRLESPPARPAGRILEGDISTTVKELVRILHEEEKLI
jgi:hypothetical protein